MVCAPLPADIEHLEVKSFEGELRLDDARRLHSGSQHVLLGGNVVWGCNPREKIKRFLLNWRM